MEENEGIFLELRTHRFFFLHNRWRSAESWWRLFRNLASACSSVTLFLSFSSIATSLSATLARRAGLA